MSEEQLHELDWIPIPNEPYIMKYAFSDTDYNIIVSNLTLMYAERLTDLNIQERFCKLNPYAQMKSQVILENLKKCLEKCLNEKSAPNMKLAENKLFITLKFPSAHVLCSYDIEMDLMAADKVMQYIISPTIFGALLSQRKVLELKKRISSESAKSSSHNICVSLQCIIEPEWLRGQNAPTETILESFLKLQNHFKELFSENEASSVLRKEKSKKGSIQHASAQKKCKLEGDITDESASVKFDDTEQNISLKKENEKSNLLPSTSSESHSQSMKNNVKKKKIFKI